MLAWLVSFCCESNEGHRTPPPLARAFHLAGRGVRDVADHRGVGTTHATSTHGITFRGELEVPDNVDFMDHDRILPVGTVYGSRMQEEGWPAKRLRPSACGTFCEILCEPRKCLGDCPIPIFSHLLNPNIRKHTSRAKMNYRQCTT